MAEFQWLSSRKIIESPYRGSKKPLISNFEQFWLPKHSRDISGIFKSIAQAEPFNEALVQIIDWASFPTEDNNPDDFMAHWYRMRERLSEVRSLEEVPSCVFTSSETNLLIETCVLLTSYGLTGYIYFDNGLILLSWEADILDLWSANNGQYKKACELLKSIKIPTVRSISHKDFLAKLKDETSSG